MSNIQNTLQLLQGVLSSSEDIRKTSSEQIEGLRRHEPDQLFLTLVTIGASASTDLQYRLLALMTLKSAIFTTWSIGFTQFEGPTVVSFEVKTQIRQSLLQLLGSDQRQIRSASASMLAKIAAVDFPDEWPDFGQIAVELVTPNDNHSNENNLSGGLQLLKDVLNDVLSEKEFFMIGNDLINNFSVIAQSPKYSSSTKILAIQCFSSCIQFFLMVNDDEKEAHEAFTQSVITLWVDNIMIPIISDTSVDKEALDLKFEIYYIIRDLDSAFLWFAEYFLVDKLLPVIWKDIIILTPYYVQYVIAYSKNDTSSDDSDTDQHFSNWAISALETLTLAVTSDEVTADSVGLTKFVSPHDILEIFSQLALMTAQNVGEWVSDSNIYVAQELELYVERHVRPLLPQIITRSQVPFQSMIDYTVSLAQARKDWATIEASLYLLGSYLLDTDDNIVSLLECSNIFELINQGVADTNEELLRCRCISTASIMTKYLQTDDLAFFTKMVDDWVAISTSSESSTIKLSVVMALDRMADRDSAPLKKYQTILFNLIASLVEDAEDETPAVLVNFTILVYKLDVIAAASESGTIVNLLFQLAAKNTSMVDLNIEVTDGFSVLARQSAEHDSYGRVMEKAISVLLGVIQNAEPTSYDYSPDLVLALDVASALLGNGPEKLSLEVVNSLLVPLYEIVMKSTDSQVLQSASEAFALLIAHGSDTIATLANGVTMTLQVAAKLLDPVCEEESAVLNAGKIVLAILSAFGSELNSQLLTDIIRATAYRLIISENVVLSENLIMVFCRLMLHSAAQIIDMLASLDNGKVLEGVMSKWLATFEIVRGYQYIKENTLALQKIFELNDSRINAISIQGDPIISDPDMIITRSKAKSLKYTEIGVQEKIVKLFVKELNNIPFEQKLVRSAVKQHQEELDDDWEDVFEIGDDGPSSDMETQDLIVGWLRVASQSPQFQEIFPRLTQQEQETLRQRLG